MSGKTKAQLQAEIRSLRAKVASISRYKLRAECEREEAKLSRDRWFGSYMKVVRKNSGRAGCNNCSYLWQESGKPYCMKHRSKITITDTASCGDFKQ